MDAESRTLLLEWRCRISWAIFLNKMLRRREKICYKFSGGETVDPAAAICTAAFKWLSWQLPRHFPGVRTVVAVRVKVVVSLSGTGVRSWTRGYRIQERTLRPCTGQSTGAEWTAAGSLGLGRGCSEPWSLDSGPPQCCWWQLYHHPTVDGVVAPLWLPLNTVQTDLLVLLSWL